MRLRHLLSNFALASLFSASAVMAQSINTASHISGIPSVANAGTSAVENPEIKKLLQYYDKQIYFTENKGQWPVNVLYKADFPLGQAIATKEGMMVSTFDQASIAARSKDVMNEERAKKKGLPYKLSAGTIKGHAWLMNFINHSPAMNIETQDMHQDFFNYVQQGVKPVLNVSNYQEVWYKNVYDKVDVRYYPSATGTLEYDIVCKPGFNKKDIAIRYDGVDNITLKKNGGVALKTSVGDMEFPAPVAYQRINGKQKSIKAEYELVGNNELTFKVSKYDASQPLIIDPIALRWATWITNNSQGDDHGHCIWVDPNSNSQSIYIAARILGTGLITTTGAFDNSYNGDASGSTDDIVLGKYIQPNAIGGAGTRVWQTYYGGHAEDNPYAMEMGPDHNLYVTGLTQSANFPMSGSTAGDTTFTADSLKIDDRSQSGDNIFVLKFDTSGTSFKAAVVGGNGDDDPFDIRITEYGDLYVCGYTNSTNLAAAGLHCTGATSGTNGGIDCFVFKMNSLLDSIYWFNNYGGSAADQANIMLQDPGTGNLFVAGQTKSTDFPVINPRQGERTGSEDGFIQKMDSNGVVFWSSYFNSAKGDSSAIICMEFNTTHDKLYFGGTTEALNASNINVVADTASEDTTYNGGNSDFFVALMDTAQNLLKSTYLGGKASELNMMGLNVDLNNDVYIFGYSNSPNFPLSTDALQSTLNPGAGNNASSADHDMTFTKLRADLDSVIYSTFYGGGIDDYDPVGQRGIKFSQCRIYTIVTAGSDNIPLTAGALTTVKKSSSTQNSTTYEPGLVVWSNPPDFNSNTISGSQTVCAGTTPSGLTGSKPSYNLPQISRNGTVTNYPVTFDSVYTYEWQSSTDSINWTDVPGGNTQNLAGSLINTSKDTTYYRRVINGDACIGIGASDQIVLLLKFTVPGTVTNITCGGNTGAITVNPINGTPPYQYAWSPGGQNTSTITNLAAGVYKVIVKDASGCTSDTTAFTVTQPANALTSTVSSTPSACNSSTGTATDSVSGGTLPYSYSWSTGAMTSSISSLAAGTYTVTVTDSNNCSVTLVDTVVNSNGPVVGITPGTPFCQGDSVQLCASGADTYVWSTGATTPCIYVGSNLAGGNSYNFSVVGTSSATQCSAGNQTTVMVNAPPNVNIVPDGPVTFCQGGSVGLCGSGAVTYIWSPGGQTSSCITVSSMGTYSVTATDAFSCVDSASVVISVNNPTTGDTSATACNSFDWYGTTYTASTNSATYTITGGNANGCDSTVTLNLTINYSDTSTTTMAACNSYTWNNVTYTAGGSYSDFFPGGNAAGCDSTANLNLTINYSDSSTTPMTACDSYTWNGSIYTATGSYSDFFPGGNAAGCDSTAMLNLTINYSDSSTTPITACNSYTWNGTTYTSGGTYTFDASPNAAGCDSTAILNLTITNTSPPNVTVANYCGYSILSTTATGSLLWSTGETTSSITVTAAGTDSVTTTVNACISAPGSATAAPYQTPAAPGVNVVDNCGNSVLTATGYTGTLSWSTGATTSSITVTSAGTYSVTQTVNTCVSSPGAGTAAPYTAPSAPVVQANNYCGSSVLSTDATGTLLWNTGATTSSITVTLAGTYSVTQAVNTCTSSPGTGIANPYQTPAAPGVIVNNYCGNSVLSTTATGSLLWSTGATTSSITVTDAATYSVTQTVNGCISGTGTGTSAPGTQGPSCSISGNNTICDGECIWLCADEGGNVTYSWSTGATTSCILINRAGTYSLTVSNGTACTSTCSKCVTMGCTPSCSITTGCDGNMMCNAEGTSMCGPYGSGYSYSWSTGATTQCIHVNATGTYSLTVYSNTGCSSTCCKYIIIGSPPPCDISGNSIICDGQSTTLCAPSGNGFTYSWSTGATTQTITVRRAGTYYVTVTNRTGCSSTCSKCVTVSSPPSCSITAGCGSNMTCDPSGTTLCGPDACDYYSWSTGATTQCIHVSVTGTYSLTVSNMNGCSSTCCKTITIGSLPSCTISGNSAICSGQSTNLCAPQGSGYSYSWSTGATTSCISVSQAANYSVTVTNSTGCSSTCSQHVRINNGTTGDTTATACNSFTWYGTVYTQSGTATHVFSGSNASGCDSTVTLYLTINNPTSGDTSATACNSFTWYGVTYTASGSSATHLLPNGNSNGCDSTVTLHLTINYPSNGDTSVTACSSFTWYGVTYTASTDTATYLLPGGNALGCDSTVTLLLTINYPTNGDTTITACGSYTLLDSTYTQSTSVYQPAGLNALGCDSTYIYNLVIIHNGGTGDTTAVACNSFTWYGVTYTASIDGPTHNFTTAAGCDSTVTLNLTVNYSDTTRSSVTACNFYKLPWEELAMTTDCYSYTYPASNTCDSVVIICVTINHSSMSDTAITACNSYTWNDSTYTTSGHYSVSFPGGNVYGCDSSAALNLTINYSDTSYNTETTCNSYTWNGSTYTTGGTYSAFFGGGNAAGCDSTAFLNLTINYSDTSYDTETACNSYIWNGVTYTTGGAYSAFFGNGNAAGCDSTAYLNLTINYSDTSYDTETACNSYTWNDSTYTVGGSYSAFFPGGNASGCDSTAFLNLTINYSDTSYDTETACNSYIWNGTTYTANGTYADFFQGGNASGCDSTAFLYLTIGYSDSSITPETACTSYLWNGVTYTANGSYSYVFPTGNAAGCDSVIILNLTINNSDSSTTTETACNSYLWNDSTYTLSGTYSDLFPGASAVGCDSIAILNLTINYSDSSTATATACNSYLWNNVTYTAGGTYTDVFPNGNAAGCDSTAILNLTINYSDSSTATATACNSYLWNNVTYTAGGTYTDVFANGNAAGCDSTAILNLTINYSDSSTTTIAACDSYSWNGVTYTVGGTYTYNASRDAAGCDSTAILNLTINTTPDVGIHASAGSICGTGSSVELCASGAATYKWSDGETTSCISVSMGGTYSVVGTNESGTCSSDSTIKINSGSVNSLRISTSGDTSFCSGGSLQLCASGAITYVWTPSGQTSACINVNSGGTYYVTGTDTTTKCSATDSIVVSQGASPSCTISGNGNICDGQYATLCAPQATGYSYSWSTGATTQCIMVQHAGTYSVTVTNSAGCSSTCSKCVIVSPVPNCCITAACGGNSCDQRGTTLCGPEGCDTYQWSTGATTQCIHVCQTGNYTLTVTNKNGCSSTCCKYITVCTPPSCNISGKTKICRGDYTTLCGPDGSGLSYCWSNGNHSQCIRVCRSGVYYLTVTNTGGCSSTCSICVQVNDAPSACISGNLYIMNGQCTTLCACTNNNSCSYSWSTGEHTRCITVRCEGVYCLTVNDGSGCSNSSCVCVTYGCSYGRSTGDATDDPMNSFGNIDVNAYPNPFNTVATISFRKTDNASHVTVEVYTLAGAKVATLFDAEAEAGTVYKTTFDATDLAEGMYIYKIISDDNVVNGKLMLVKH